MSVRILTGDCRAVLAGMDAESVHCVVTSPPYWGLRDYGVDGQMGMEPTLGEHIEGMVAVFREVRRVLRKDGTLWLNYGDCYANDTKWGGSTGGKHVGRLHGATNVGRAKKVTGLKPKDLCMVPNRMAIALQDDGWWVRSEIIWAKPNPMPESVTDRPSGAHEKIWLLAKSPRYYFDQEAVPQPVTGGTHARISQDVANQVGSDRANAGGKTNGNMKAVIRAPKTAEPGQGIKNNQSFADATCLPVHERNIRNVWEVTTRGYSEAHFATFPPALIEPCIKAGCPEGGTVLDPFGGAGTTGLVADRLKRDAILIELNPEYAEMARRRIKDDAGMFGDVRADSGRVA